jgi:hypothetical protein
MSGVVAAMPDVVAVTSYRVAVTPCSVAITSGGVAVTLPVALEYAMCGIKHVSKIVLRPAI